MMEIARAYLKPTREKSVRRRHPWIFSGAVERVDGEPRSGDVVRVHDHAGAFLAYAAYSPASQMRLRIFSFDEGEMVDAAFIEHLVERAIERRAALGWLDEEGGCRLVFGESDGLPGLIVDRYARFLVCQLSAAGIEPWREAVLDALERVLSPHGIYERSDATARRKEGLPQTHGSLRGAEPPSRIGIVTDGLRQEVDIEHGQKTGAYLDQRVNRSRVAGHARGGRVLDAYAYGGAFGLRCLLGGAAEAVLVDASAHALETASEQARQNGVAERCRTVHGDVPEELRRLRRDGERFDLVILDPPKFVHAAEQVQAGSRGYKDVNRLALELLRPGGVLATFSCSSHVDAALFQKIVAGAALDAGRGAQILERLSQPPDHPVALNFPEAQYLKGLILRVD